MFAVCRFAHYLKCIVRDKVGSYYEKEQLQKWLTNWISEYVDGDPVNSTEATKCRRPLAGASIKIVENEENPGYLFRDFRASATLPARRNGYRPSAGVAVAGCQINLNAVALACDQQTRYDTLKPDWSIGRVNLGKQSSRGTPWRRCF